MPSRRIIPTSIPKFQQQLFRISAFTHPMPIKTKTPSAQSASIPPGEPVAIRVSAFNDLGFQPTIDLLCEEIQELYLADEVPWILGYHKALAPFLARHYQFAA
jgi:hypothetical protein